MRTLMRNTYLLTASSLIMQVIGLVFQIWLIGRIGASGIGLFQLVMSVGGLCSTLAISGIRFTSTRLISEEIGFSRSGGVGMVMARCLAYSAVFGCAALAALYIFAEPIGFLWIGDARTVRSLRMLSLSMPFMSLSSVFAGYFTAVGRVHKSAAIQISEQLVRIVLVAALLGPACSGNIEDSCFSICKAGTLAEVFGFAVFLAVFLLDRRKFFSEKSRSPGLTARMLRIAVPLALSAYARTSLSTLQHLLVPRELRRSGRSADSALADYGTVNGMVFPVVMFPSCFLSALAETLVPTLTEAQVSGQDELISETVSKLLMKSLLFSAVCSVILFSAADALGSVIYHSAEAGRYIRIFVPIVPVMYLDIVADGCLKGLGAMMWSMTVNIIDALSGVVLVAVLVPSFGIAGYIAVIYITELLNFALSIAKLSSLTAIAPRWRKHRVRR